MGQSGGVVPVGKVYEALDDRLVRWIEHQPMFFVATAPLAADGRVNVSPKGMRGTFRVLGPTTVAYLDLVGSGIETVAHLRENGRITVMFCAFDGPPKIVRLHGRGSVNAPGDDGYEDLVGGFGPCGNGPIAPRTVVVVEVERISDSCGYGVPLMEYVADRDQHERWVEAKAAKGGSGWKAEYIGAKNAESIDGLPGVDAAAYGGPPERTSADES